MNILHAMDDPNVFGQHFRDSTSWSGWRAFLAALFGLPMDETERRIFRRCTSLHKPPKGVSEAWVVVGRRGGKSFVLALIAVYLACFKDWRPYLGPGERATVMVLAADRKQARVIMRYVKGLLQSIPMLARTIEGETQETISLKNRVVVEIHTASFRTTRGYTIVAALCDEIAFWPSDESANPDVEIIAALRPAMSTVPGALLLCASSPYARRGSLWGAYNKYFGKADPKVLVWQAPSRTMNPTIPQAVIDQALDDDPAHARAEWLAEFRSDIESYISRESVAAVMARGVRERAPIAGISYSAFVDPSGGVNDAMTLAIAHLEGEVALLDCIRELRPPFSPESVVDEFATVLRSYRVSSIRGDRYAGEWPREQFAKRGIEYRPAHKPKSDIYRDVLPLINSGRVELLDNERLLNQFVSLERRTARGGRDSIDHAPHAHDDLANAVAGVLVTVIKNKRAEQMEIGLPIILRPGLVDLNEELRDVYSYGVRW